MKNFIRYFFIFIPFCVISQQDLSLENAIKIGLKQNFEIQLSKKDLEINKLNNSLGNAGALPTLDISARTEKSISDQTKNPTSFIQAMLKSGSINSAANISWTLLNGYRIKATKEKLNQLEYLSNGNLTLTIENTTQAIILSYYNCLLQKERLNLLQNVVNLSRERLIYYKTKNDIGIISRIDLLQFENTLLSDSSNLLTQKLNYKNSIKNLNLVLGVDLNAEWNFTDDMNSETRIFNYLSLEEKTLLNNTNIRNQSINNEIIRQDIVTAKSAYLPMVTFNSGAAYNRSVYDLGDSGLEVDNIGQALNYYANLSINFRLYDGGKYRKILKESELRKDINNLNLERKKRDVLNKLSIYYEKYNSNIIQYNLSKKAYELAEINYEISNEKNNRGQINSFNLRDIEITYINSGINYLQSLYSLNESYLELVKITGGILEVND